MCHQSEAVDETVSDVFSILRRKKVSFTSLQQKDTNGPPSGSDIHAKVHVPVILYVIPVKHRIVDLCLFASAVSAAQNENLIDVQERKEGHHQEKMY